MRSLVCMKWGTKYGPEYVNRLYTQACINLTPALRFVCFTDNGEGLDADIEVHPLPQWHIDEQKLLRPGMDTWRKISLFRPGLAKLEGDILYLDLDVVITGNLDGLFTFNPGRFCVIRDWMEQRRYWRRYGPRAGADINTSVFRFNSARHGFIFDNFVTKQSQIMDKFRIEQQYVGETITVAGEKTYWPGEWIVSFKRQCIPTIPSNLWRQPRQPEGARVIVFHGHPLPHEAIDGHVTHRLDRYCKPTPWLKRYWL